MSKVLLKTPRLILRQFTPRDADNLVELDADPEVLRFINGGKATPRSIVETEVLPLFLASDPDQSPLGFWAADARDTNRFLGWFALRPAPDTTDQISLGYRFQRADWGRGYATEGARALIDLAFSRHGISCVRATTYEQNTASIKVMEKLGMRLERSFRYTQADLNGMDTAHPQGDALWEGLDLEYVLNREDWTPAID